MATERQPAAARRNVEKAVGASKAKRREIPGPSRTGRDELARALGHRGA